MGLFTVLLKNNPHGIYELYEYMHFTQRPVKYLSNQANKPVYQTASRLNSRQDLNSTSGQIYDPMNSAITLCRKGWCSQGYFVDNALGPAILNGTVNDFSASYEMLSHGFWANVTGNILHSFPEPADIGTSWTQVSFPVHRYGYGWGFDTVAVKVATAVLILHAVIIIAHCCLFIYNGVAYSFIGSLGDLVALALILKPPSTFSCTSVGIARRSTWSQPTTVKEVGAKDYGISRLALVLGGDLEATDEKAISHRRPQIGRGYE